LLEGCTDHILLAGALQRCSYRIKFHSQPQRQGSRRRARDDGASFFPIVVLSELLSYAQPYIPTFMDALSVATAIITLASAISEGLRQAQTLRDAPVEIHALANDVIDLDIILQEVVKTLQEWSLPGKGHCSPSTSENLSTVLGRAQTKLLELDSIFNRVLIEDPVTNRVKYARLGWLRQKSKVEGIRKDLASIKLSLNNVMEAANS
jgi:hypothetical protein